MALTKLEDLWPEVFSTGMIAYYDINMYSQVDIHFQENWWITKASSQFVAVLVSQASEVT